MIGEFRKRLMAGFLATAVLTGCHIGPNARGFNVEYLDDYNSAQGNLIVLYKNRKDLDDAFRIIRSFKWLGNDIEAVRVENPDDYYQTYAGLNGKFDKMVKERGLKVSDEEDPVIIHREINRRGEFETKALYRPN
ncbi:hypothetical protein J4414_02270 [Candidatus Woesearchaeota archaeon]|nr:hypothetical protein [Candidatus Woesearchaeota archaeon]